MAKFSIFKRRTLWGATIGGALLFFIAGIIFWGGFNTVMEATNELTFCISCHEMEDNVYTEYAPTIHHSNRTGVRAACADCHVPKSWGHKMVRKIQASNEVFHWLMGTVNTPEKFDEHRLTMAKRVWNTMKKTDSRECRNCHNLESMNPKFQKPRARKQHLNAFETGQTCIDCHKGIAHKGVRDLLTDEELDALEAPNPTFARPVPAIFTAGLAEVEAIEAEQEALDTAEKEKQQEAKAVAKKDEKARIEAAVAAALAAQVASNAVAPEQASDTSPASGETAAGFGIDWSDVPARPVTIFYPGQTSMEWVLNGRDHGGSRAFLKSGDSCASCHDKETADMGEKMVNGEKAEETPIPGKRGSIPVDVQAAYDDSNVYFRFAWDDTEHVAVPFVDGGKMDPQNEMKIAIMLSNDAPEYAAQAGCWATCHHDARTMPDTPDADAIAASAAAGILDISNGVTKYLKESRTDIEIKGRGDKPRGGWDKLKPAEELKAGQDAGMFMDLLRYRSGDGATEDGQVFGERSMQGGQGFEAISRKEGKRWIVEMKRPLQSDKSGDISLAADQMYNFGFAIHDDFSNARFHHVSLGYKLGFDNEQAEIQAVKREAATATPSTAAPAADVAADTASSEATAATGSEQIAVDWSKSGSREITLFYPGQTSMEWVLNGRDHGGSRAFLKSGDSCASCHDKETASMGEKMVNGEKAEETPIPGKRGSIPVDVNASYDDDNLYLKFSWEKTGHVDVPFADGGKLDPDNEMKIALMLATDELEYVGQAGCWATCHHDSRSMPDAPAADAIAGSEAASLLDISNGITKYVKESRTDIEIKGRGDKPRGGWDKLISAAEIQAADGSSAVMDLLRYKSGSGESQNGHVFEQRTMQGGEDFIVNARDDGNRWIVEIARPLKSDKPGDITLTPGEKYNFGFAIHDDFSSARFHHVSLGYKLGFDDADSDVNAMRQ